ncbi:hypothetical protein J5N97_024560 [Dioscorea zingiberensis]|uniref:Aminotransferase-like plant mobile domain-containing protein n=1 Tax=Dioscorea zingiberensis TaxID=325984 RepID=A0A9D5C763_9LILI|nr:hypothetical protein J5N97_024560 [Dioscorea zingiberensis]
MDNNDNDRIVDPLDAANTPMHKCRCALHMIGCLLTLLNNEQKEVLISFDFGGLLQARSYSLRMGLVEDWIVCFDPDTGILSVHGQVLRMTAAHAGSLLGLPINGPDMESILDRDGVPGVDLPIERAKMTPSALFASLTKKPTGEDFTRILLLYIITTIIRPTRNNHIPSTYLSLLPYIDEIKNLNWAKYAHEGMLAAVQTYKRGQAKAAKNKRIGGCVWLLQLFYVEHRSIGIIHQPLCEREQPRIAFWTDALISRVVKHINTRRGNRQEDHPVRAEVSDLRRDFGVLKSRVDEISVSLTHGMATLHSGIDRIKCCCQFTWPMEVTRLRPE